MEAFAVTVTGGLLGIAIGLAIAMGVAAYAGWKTMREAARRTRCLLTPGDAPRRDRQ